MEEVNHTNQPVSPETRNALYENMGKTIECFSPLLKGCVIQKQALALNFGEIPDENRGRIFDVFLSLHMYVLYMNVELASVLRGCFRADAPSEKRYNIKYINCVILEGYKYLYGYERSRKLSLWGTKVRALLKIVREQEFEDDFKVLEEQIVAFGEADITDVEQRNLSFHYDWEPIKVYDMLVGLSEEVEVRRLNRFMELLEKLSLFVGKYIGKYWVDVGVDTAGKYTFSFADVDVFRNNKDMLYSRLGSSIDNYAQHLDDLVRHRKIPGWMRSQFKEMDKATDSFIGEMLQLEKSAMQLMFLYIDLASASRAYISSEYTMEKQLALKQINTIAYEGFCKLYGKEGDKEDSFWKKCISPILSDVVDRELMETFEKLACELDLLEGESKKWESQRQLAVHLKKGIIPVYDMLHALNPIEEFQKALLLLNLLPKILDLSTRCLCVIDAKRSACHERQVLSTNKTIDGIIGLIERMPDSPQKKDWIEKFKKFQTDEFWEDFLRK